MASLYFATFFPNCPSFERQLQIWDNFRSFLIYQRDHQDQLVRHIRATSAPEAAHQMLDEFERYDHAIDRTRRAEDGGE